MYDLEELWALYHKKLLNFIRTRVDSDNAEDLLQDVFLKIHQNINTLRESNKFESWMFQITRNAIVDFYKKRHKESTIPEWAIDTPTDTNDTKEVHHELSACLTPFIEQLPNKYKNAILMSDIQGKTQMDVAQIENISLPGAKSRVQRGRALLKNMFYECCQLTSINSGGSATCQDTNNSCDRC